MVKFINARGPKVYKMLKMITYVFVCARIHAHTNMSACTHTHKQTHSHKHTHTQTILICRM